jgi:hypothetical protein
MTAAQKSADGIVGGGNEPADDRRSHPAEGPNGPRKGLNGKASRTWISWTTNGRQVSKG